MLNDHNQIQVYAHTQVIEKKNKKNKTKKQNKKTVDECNETIIDKRSKRLHTTNSRGSCQL